MSDMKVSIERTAPFSDPVCMTKVTEGVSRLPPLSPEERVTDTKQQVIGARTLNYTVPGTAPFRVHARYVHSRMRTVGLMNSVNLMNQDAMVSTPLKSHAIHGTDTTIVLCLPYEHVRQ